ncbi:MULTISPECIES: hypothetical protein [Bacillus]|nr:hypothetical protein [Bacillus xiamenensis]
MGKKLVITCSLLGLFISTVALLPHSQAENVYETKDVRPGV